MKGRDVTWLECCLQVCCLCASSSSCALDCAAAKPTDLPFIAAFAIICPMHCLHLVFHNSLELLEDDRCLICPTHCICHPTLVRTQQRGHLLPNLYPQCHQQLVVHEEVISASLAPLIASLLSATFWLCGKRWLAGKLLVDSQMYIQRTCHFHKLGKLHSSLPCRHCCYMLGLSASHVSRHNSGTRLCKA